jgi:hypothetical protein
MKKMTDSQQRMAVRRRILREKSTQARKLRVTMINEALSVGNRPEADRIAMTKLNDVLLDMYRDDTGAREFKTLAEWNRNGYRVKRGERAFYLWGGKRKAINEQGNEYHYFSLCWVFSDRQVELAVFGNCKTGRAAGERP